MESTNQVGYQYDLVVNILADIMVEYLKSHPAEEACFVNREADSNASQSKTSLAMTA